MKNILSLFLVSFALTAQAQITSTFDTDADGWTFSNNGTPVTVNHNASNGNPGGFVATAPYSSNTTATSQAWFAPAKFLGTHVARSYGMNLRLDMQQAFAGTASAGQGDIRIVTTGSFILVFSLPVKPAVTPAWSSYTIKLDETGGWRVGSTGGALATKDDVLRALSNITALEIRGTYITNASNVVGLDNVVLEQKTLAVAPVVFAISATSGKPGDVITINGSGFNTTAASNAVTFGLYGKVKAVVQSATATQLTVVVPQNACYGPITITNTATGLSATTAPFTPVFDGGGRIIPASFKPKFDISTILIESVSVADVDGDGWNDLVVTNDFSDRVIDIYRNLGTGGSLSAASFAAKVSFAYTGVSSNSSGLFFADLDGDGKQDAITSTATAGFVGVYVTMRNTSTPGNISFEAPEYWRGGTDESPIALVADLDGDGHPDFVAGEGAIPGAMWFNQNVSSLGNIEFGSYVGPVGLSVVNGFSGANAGDLNGDGKPELVISNGQGGAIDILQNTSTPGAPLFIEAFQIAVSHASILIADMNLDGKNDLIYKSGVGFRIRLNTDTDGTLTAADFATDIIITGDLVGTGDISIGDINGDGKPDILDRDDFEVGVFENIYAGGAFDANAFVRAHQSEGTQNTVPSAPLGADLNGDGKPEIIVSVRSGGPSKLSIYENRNVHAPVIAVNTVSPLAAPIGATVTITGDFFSTTPSQNIVRFGAVKATVLTATKTQITVSVPPGAAYAPVSVTKDGLTSTYRLPFKTTFSSGITFDNTHFAPPVNYTLTTANYDIVVGDLNNDGKPDVVADAGNPLVFASMSYAFRNEYSSGAISTSTLVPNDTIGPANFRNPTLQDFDGDGYLDVMDGETDVKRNITSGTAINFTPPVSFATSGFISFGDFNADGKVDVAATNTGLNLQILENRLVDNTFVTTPLSSFSTVINFTRPSGNGGAVVAGDFDGDGFDDAITANSNVDNISIFRNLGLLRITTAQFAPRVDVAVGDIPSLIYSADFDADGKLDLLFQYGTGTNPTMLTIMHNTSTIGNISFNRFDLTNLGNPTRTTIADLDGDGKPEILTTTEAGNLFSIFKNTHTSGALTAASFAAPFNTTVTAPRGITTGDLNLDGKPEIILTRATGLLVVYENLISSGPTITISPQPASSAVCDGDNASFTLTASGTTNLSYQWQKFNSLDFSFNNITDGGGYTGSSTATLNINTTGNFGAGDYRCKVSGDLATDVFSATVTLTVNTVPAAPITTGASNCVAAAITLNASGGSNGQYRWYDVDTGGTAIAGQTNSAYTTPVINTTTTYYASLRIGSCESTRTPVTATIAPISKPTIFFDPPIFNAGSTINLCSGDVQKFSAPSGFSAYAWSNGETTEEITITSSGVYSVTVEDAAGCISPPSDPLTVVINPYPTAIITVNGTELTASTGDSYQWYQNGDEVDGATDQSFEFNVLEYGVYTVAVTDNGCRDLSDEFVYLITSSKNTDLQWKVYPNPFNNFLMIESSSNQTATFEIVDMLGRLVKQSSFQDQYILSGSTLQSGTYYITIHTRDKNLRFKIIKTD